jgi:hypothetical protein
VTYQENEEGKRFTTTKYTAYKEEHYFDFRLEQCDNDRYSDTLKVGEGFIGDVIKLETLTCSDWRE